LTLVTMCVTPEGLENKQNSRLLSGGQKPAGLDSAHRFETGDPAIVRLPLEAP
jgi:hypothetical protein